MQGEFAETLALLEFLRRAGAEVQQGGTRNRGPFVHTYAVVRLPDGAAPAADPGPVRVPSTVVAGELTAGRRRLHGRRR